MAERPNGLATLSDARQRARRTMPPPRHPVARDEDSPKPSSATTAPRAEEHPAPSPVADSQPRAEATASPRPDTAVRPPSKPAVRSAASDVVVEPPVKLTLYLDQDIDRYLEDVRIQGLTSRPRVDVSRSAVVRLALRRLRAEMTPEQVKTLLAGQPTDGSRTGRKRR